jgi:hypothetical protein
VEPIFSPTPTLVNPVGEGSHAANGQTIGLVMGVFVATVLNQGELS